MPVYRRVLSDVLTPVSAFHKIDDGGSACLFESVIGGEKVGRYSFLAAEPFLLLEACGISDVTVDSQRRRRTSECDADNPLDDAARSVCKRIRVAKLPELPPFVGGAVGYAGYDTVRYVENLPNAPTDDRSLPDLSFAFYDHMIVFDNVQKTAIVVVLGEGRAASREAGSAGASCATLTTTRAGASIDWSRSSRRRPTRWRRRISTPAASRSLHYESNFTQPQFEDAVRKCVEYIRAGDIFQVVISQRLAVPLAVDPFEVYRTLRVVNPSPFMFFLRTPKCTLVGSSPEIMVRVVDGKVTVRPLAGTRRRGRTEEEDQRLAEELLADPKERAEHVMLVDLGRNDVGRVARYGSVEVSDVMVIERYSHVMHITSNVTGQLTDGPRRVRRAGRLPAGRHGLRRAEGAGDADHRRDRAAPPRPVRRRRRLHRLRRQHGHVHRAADDRHSERHGVRAGRRRHRRRQRAGARIRRNAQQGPRAA